MSDDIQGALEETRQLLEAEAERRGISVKDLVDQLAREGRRTGLANIDSQDDPTEWTTTAVVRDGIVRGGEEKTVSVQPLVFPEVFGGPVTILDGAEGAVIVGAMGSGKTNAADLTRSRLETAGIPFEETVRTDEFGVQRIEFAYEWPEEGDGK
ncbi:hypothetical protein [Streptomyces sp. NPDC015350]|uniref:hypothetical protein n=1 Tax=Streptomyces sp. NPDC015350 TaxID=3364955 RepID=UPI00370310FC